jgi:hypothetical protein
MVSYLRLRELPDVETCKSICWCSPYPCRLQLKRSSKIQIPSTARRRSSDDIKAHLVHVWLGSPLSWFKLQVGRWLRGATASSEVVQFEFSKTVLHLAAPGGFTQRRKGRKGRKEGQNEGPLFPSPPSRTLRLCVKPCRKPAGKFKPYHYRVFPALAASPRRMYTEWLSERCNVPDTLTCLLTFNITVHCFPLLSLRFT